MPRLLLLLCLTPTGCMTGLLWSTYRPLADTQRGAYLQAAIDPRPGPPRLLLRCAFPGSGESAVIAVTPPDQELEILADQALVDPVPLVAGEPATVGGFHLFLRDEGPLEIEGAIWEWRLPEQKDGTRARSVREIALVRDDDERLIVSLDLWYGEGTRRYVKLRGTRAVFDDNPAWDRGSFPLVAQLRERAAHRVLEIEGATRVLDRPRRQTLTTDHAKAAWRGAVTPWSVAADVATLPVQIPLWISFAISPPQIPSRAARAEVAPRRRPMPAQPEEE